MVGDGAVITGQDTTTVIGMVIMTDIMVILTVRAEVIITMAIDQDLVVVLQYQETTCQEDLKVVRRMELKPQPEV
jgi:ethanolamine ammonia-lyase large subunit